MCKPLVGIDFVEPPRAEVIDHGSRRKGDAVPIAGAKSEVLQAGGDGRDCLLAVGGAAGKDDGIGERGAITVSQTVGIDGARRTAANVNRDRGAILELNDGEPGRSFFVAAHPDLDRWPVEAQGRASDLRICLKDALVSMRQTENGRADHYYPRKDSGLPRARRHRRNPPFLRPPRQNGTPMRSDLVMQTASPWPNDPLSADRRTTS